MTMPSVSGTTVRMPAHRAATHLVGGDCRSGPSTSCGVQDCTWPYRMMKMARKAPVRERDQPMPLSGERRKKGRGTSNHRSREPKRKTRESDSTLMLGLLLQRGGRVGEARCEEGAPPGPARHNRGSNAALEAGARSLEELADRDVLLAGAAQLVGEAGGGPGDGGQDEAAQDAKGHVVAGGGERGGGRREERVGVNGSAVSEAVQCGAREAGSSSGHACRALCSPGAHLTPTVAAPRK